MSLYFVWNESGTVKTTVVLEDISVEQVLTQGMCIYCLISIGMDVFLFFYYLAAVKNIFGDKLFLEDGCTEVDTMSLPFFKNKVLVVKNTVQNVSNEDGPEWSDLDEPESENDTEKTRYNYDDPTVDYNNYDNAPPVETKPYFDFFPKKIQNKLNSISDLLPTEKKEIVRQVVMVLQKEYGIRQDVEFLKKEAINLCKCYVKLNQFDGEGNILGLGYYTLLKSIQQRYWYLNRPEVVKKIKKVKGTSSVLEPPVKKLRRTGPYPKSISAGCSMYLPTQMNSDERSICCDRKNWLKMQSQLEIRDDAKVELLMQQTYNMQREFITTKPFPHAKQLLEDWPMIFKPLYLIKHFKTLCNIDFDNDLLVTRFRKIYKCLNNLVPDEDENFLLTTVQDLFKYFKDGNSESLISITEVFKL